MTKCYFTPTIFFWNFPLEGFELGISFLKRNLNFDASNYESDVKNMINFKIKTKTYLWNFNDGNYIIKQ